jgi:hypothetical protein
MAYQENHHMPITSVSAVYQLNAQQNNSAPKTPVPAAPPAQKPDSVHLSAAALAGGDVDHDGDSH